MNRIYSVVVSAVLIAWALPPTQARSKPKDASLEVQAMGIFQEIEATSAEIADVADQLAERSKGPADPEMYLEGLDTLKSDVNSIGRDLTTLDGERASLAPWEVEALDRATSLMQDVAANAQKAIETYNSDRSHLWATSYPAVTGKASDEAGQVKALLSGYLKLTEARAREDRLEHNLQVAPQS